MSTARLRNVRFPAKARALCAGAAMMLVLGTGAAAPLSGIAQGEPFDVAVESVESLSGLSAVVANSEEGVNLRAEASHDAEILTTLAEGTVVTLLIDQFDTVYDPDGVTRWWPVSADGQDGWVSGFYLATTDAAPAEAAEVSEETVAESDEADESDDAADEAGESDGAADDDGDDTATDLPDDAFDVEVSSVDDLSGLTALVASPDGVNLRAEPDATAEIVTTVPGGEVVSLRIDVADTATDEDGNRWWPVSYNGSDGWIVGAYLADSGGATPSSAAGESAETSAGQAPARFSAGDYVAATTGDGDGVNIRDGAGLDTAAISGIPENGVVQVMDGPFFDDDGNAWYLITDGDVTGYSDGDLLTLASRPDVPLDETVALEPAEFGPGQVTAVRTQDGVGANVRAEATTGSDLVGTLIEETVVDILDGPFYDGRGNDWYQIEASDLIGFVAGDLMDPYQEPAPEQPRPVSGPTGTFINPLPGGAFTQAYGCSPFAFQPFNAALGCNFHNGIDLALPAGTPLLASDGGTVTAAGWCDCGLGYYVTIDHGNGFRTTYGHLMDMPWVAVGQAVNQGQEIGPVGSTGLSTGPHVHFILELDGTTVDPLGYVSI
ncbi:MAG: SH3 domain-containing protein [Thermomicrobiales bacterium]